MVVRACLFDLEADVLDDVVGEQLSAHLRNPAAGLLLLSQEAEKEIAAIQQEVGK